MDKLNSSLSQMRRLARLYGVQSYYCNVYGKRVYAIPRALMLVLRALGAELRGLGDVSTALRQFRINRWRRIMEPVIVVWDSLPTQVYVRIHSSMLLEKTNLSLKYENGQKKTWTVDLGKLPPQESAEIDGEKYVSKSLSLPSPLPMGYHRLSIGISGSSRECLIISAPTKAYDQKNNKAIRRWGAFTPLYALHSRRSWGAGDYTDLETLISWVAELEGGVVATLPLLAAMVDKEGYCSPYSPVSRLFWNELYIDPTREYGIAEKESQASIEPDVQEEIEKLRRSPLIDYRALANIKRKVLSKMAQSFFAKDPNEVDLFRNFLHSRPEAIEYSKFMATQEQVGLPWREWPNRLREGKIGRGDYEEEAYKYYLYGQWLAHEQLKQAADKAYASKVSLSMDFPLGVSPNSYDAWRWRSQFVDCATVGAPPDSVFTKGQDWSFYPLHPERIRQDMYRYFIECIRFHMKVADILHIDHVMALHRLFWVPKGLTPAEGVYVRYRSEEFYAILCLESHRNRCVVIGENLGTVPRYIDKTMAHHNIQRMYVLQYALSSDPHMPLVHIPASSIASLNTHDMPTFAGFWHGLDIAERVALGLLDKRGAETEKRRRKAIHRALVKLLRREGLVGRKVSVQEVLAACLKYLAKSRARLMLANIEDLWLETKPQNVPGTTHERPNWKRKLRPSIEEFTKDTHTIKLLRCLNSCRGQGELSKNRPR